MPTPPSPKTIPQLPSHVAADLTGAELIPLYGPGWTAGGQTGQISLSALASFIDAVPPAIAANTLYGNNTVFTAPPVALTPTQVKTLLAISYLDVAGLGGLALLGAAPAGTLTGTTINATVVSSSLTSVGALSIGSAVSGFTVADACLTANVPLKNTANTFTAANYFTGTGGVNVGSATAPKGTGVAGSKLEVTGTGTGASAFGSIALSRADGTSLTTVGSIDFYTVTTLAGQFQCYQAGGGPGGVNYFNFNLGSAGTMVTPMQLQYASGSALGTLLVGASNGSVQGKIQVFNYLNASITTGITLSNPVSSGGTGGCGLTWIDGAGGNSIGQIRTHYMSVAGVGDVVITVGQGTTNGLQDFVRFTNTNYINFYALSSTTNRLQGYVQPTWKVSTDATRIGQVNFGVTGIIAGVEANQVAIQLIAQDCNLTNYVNEYPLVNFPAYVQFNVSASANRSNVNQFIIRDGSNFRYNFSYDATGTRMKMFGSNGIAYLQFDMGNGGVTVYSASGGITILSGSGSNGFSGNNSFSAVCNGDTWITSSGNDTVRTIVKGMATQSADLMQFQDSTGAVLSAFKRNGNLGVGTSAALKGTGNQKVEIAGTGTGVSAFGSIAISRADSTSNSVVGSIDFYTISTLAGQIQCFQQSGGAGGINYLYFNLGAAGTLHTCAYLAYTNSTSLSTFYVGTATNRPGKLQIQNYASASNTVAVQLSNPVSPADTGSTSILWSDGAGNSIGQIRTNYMATAGVGDIVFSVGTGTTNNLQDFVKFTSSSHMDFYLLDSTTNQKVGGIYPQWQTPTDATRAGQINFTAMNTVNELIAFTYWADSSTSTRMQINCNNVAFLGTNQTNFSAGIQMPATVNILFNSIAASAGTPLTSSGSLRLNSTYWNGTASANMTSYLGSRSAYTTQGCTTMFYSVNPGGGVTDMFIAGGSTTAAEVSQITLSNVITSNLLSYATFGVITAWANNTPATRQSTASLNAYYIATAQNAVQLDAVSSGVQPNLSLVLGSVTASYGSGVGVIFIANRTTAPTGSPVGGGLVYTEAGSLKFKGSSGTVTVLAPA